MSQPSNDNAPVLVGISQIEQRFDENRQPKEPLDLMIEATRLAAVDAGCPGLLTEASSVRVVRGLWRYENPARAVAEAVGCPGAKTVGTHLGGQMVQLTLLDAAVEIQAGRHDIVILTGGEAGHSRPKLRALGREVNWRKAPGAPDRILGSEVPIRSEAEAAVGIYRVNEFYALIESAIRHANGESPDEHRKRISELWARLSQVAAGNPHAWIRTPVSPEEIRTPSPGNRWVATPYTKLLNSNSRVDQAAALILCSRATAARCGIPAEKWIHPWAGTAADDTKYLSRRQQVNGSAAMRIAGRRCLELVDRAAADLDYIDVYSCFPSAVQVCAKELDIDLERPLSVTGGLTFAGGPLNNYVMHSIARMAELLRENPGTTGFVTANGGVLSKHAFGVYSAEPPPRPFRFESLQNQADAAPTRNETLTFTGPSPIESYTVLHRPDGPEVGYVTTLTASGERAWGRVEAPDVLMDMTASEYVGRIGHFGADLRVSFS